MLHLVQPMRVQVHDQHDLAFGAVLRLIEQAVSPNDTADILEALCREVGSLLSAPVVSVYVREEEPLSDRLVMRANVGLPRHVVGRVSLGIGEGITGFAAECLRPVSADVGPAHARFKAVPGIGEEAFPCFLAVPLSAGGQASGVMVLQRPTGRPFQEAEVVLGVALAAPFAYALDPAARTRIATTRARDVELSGEPTAPGTGIGWARLLPTMEGLLDSRAFDVAAVLCAYDEVGRDLAESAKKVMGRLPHAAMMSLGGLVPLLSDERLREHLVRTCGQRGVRPGLEAVVQAYARTPYRVGGEAAPWLVERAQDVEDLCLLVAARIAGESPCRAGDVLFLSGRLGGVMALTAAARRVSAVVVANDTDREGLAASILRQSGIPVVASVSRLAEWARPGDKLLVDGDEGTVRVNPAPQRIARHRISQRGRATAPARWRRAPRGE